MIINANLFANCDLSKSKLAWSLSGDFRIVLVDNETPRDAISTTVKYYDIHVNSTRIEIQSCIIMDVIASACSLLHSASGIPISNDILNSTPLWLYYNGNGHIALGRNSKPELVLREFLVNPSMTVAVETSLIISAVDTDLNRMSRIQSIGFASCISAGGMNDVAFLDPLRELSRLSSPLTLSDPVTFYVPQGQTFIMKDAFTVTAPGFRPSQILISAIPVRDTNYRNTLIEAFSLESYSWSSGFDFTLEDLQDGRVRFNPDRYTSRDSNQVIEHLPQIFTITAKIVTPDLRTLQTSLNLVTFVCIVFFSPQNPRFIARQNEKIIQS